MPNPQTTNSRASTRGNSSASATRSASTRRGGTAGTVENTVESNTVESDETYGIVSVLYHALQGAETIGQYIDDARAADNEQLVAFFEDCKAKQNEIALQGKRLLAEQLLDLAEDAEEEADDTEDEA